jgi:SAM-dependent methyltransferase
MTNESDGDNRFQEFFEDGGYVSLKNHLYNYLLRKRAVEKALPKGQKGLILETGSGISPMVTSVDSVVYSDLSLSAMQTLKQKHGKGLYVVADAMHLPFRPETFSCAVSSEVLEHLPDDQKALREIARVLKPSGSFVVTFPHRRFYFAGDDRFVGHHRRYELCDMEDLLREAGIEPVSIRKVLGPLEKLTMIAAVFCFFLLSKWRSRHPSKAAKKGQSIFIIRLFMLSNRLYAGLAWLDAHIFPRALSTVVLIRALKRLNPHNKFPLPLPPWRSESEDFR